MEMSRQRSSRDVLLIWLMKLQERVKRVDTFVRDTPPFTERRAEIWRDRENCGTRTRWARSLWPYAVRRIYERGEREEVREVLVSLHIRYDYLVVFHHLADKKMTALHMRHA